MLRQLLVIFLMLNLFVLAQDDDIISATTRVTISPLFQDWSSDSLGEVRDFSEFSTALSAYIPISERVSMSLWLAQANVRFGDTDSLNNKNIRDLSGISDIQMGASYYVPGIQSVLSLKLNLPVGKKELNRREFDTSAIIANSVYRFQVPNLGQGFNISPGITWANQINDNSAVGLGISYNYRGKYKAVDVVEDFDPGDELLVTGGFDYRLNAVSTISSDLTLTTYTRDKVGDEEIFAAGNRWVFTTQYHRYFDFNELRVVFRFRNQGKSEVFLLGRENNVIPTNFHFFSSYTWLLNPAFNMGFFLEGRFYGKVEGLNVPFADGNLFGLGFYPEVIISKKVRLPIRMKYMSASFANEVSLTGLDLGLGLSFAF